MKMLKSLLGVLVTSAISLFANEGAELYKKCAGCHGANGEKVALGRSQVIKGWDVNKTETVLKGYKEGTYGKEMKGLMQGQVSSLSEDNIKVLAKFIAALK